MTQFPQTQHSLILRLGSRGSESDWSRFLADYWSPICRFAARWGKLHLDEAEEIASCTIEAVIANNLLSRWSESQNSKLRTLLCGVVRKIISNRARIRSGRERIQQDHRLEILALGSVKLEDCVGDTDGEDAMYAAWVDELLQESLHALHVEYLRSGRADCFRVLYGRICDSMNNKELSESLNLKITDVENYFKRAKDHLATQLRMSLENRVRRYCQPEDVDKEFSVEWRSLGEFLQEHGGLEDAIRRSYELSSEIHAREKNSTVMILRRLQNGPDAKP